MPTDLQVDAFLEGKLAAAIGSDAAKQLLAVIKDAAKANREITGNLQIDGAFTVLGASGLAALALTGGLKVKRSTVAAAGSTKTDAAALSTGFNSVTAANGTKGVILPAMVAGEVCIVVNTVGSQNLKIYPSAGNAIDALGADTALVLATKMAVIIADSAAQAYSLAGA